MHGRPGGVAALLYGGAWGCLDFRPIVWSFLFGSDGQVVCHDIECQQSDNYDMCKIGARGALEVDLENQSSKHCHRMIEMQHAS